MEYQEFPKALYRQGVYQAVSDKGEEADLRAAGWADWHTDYERMNAPAEDAAEDKPAPTKRAYNKKAT